MVQRGADGKTGDSRVVKWKAHRLLVAHRYVSFGLENELVAHTEKLRDFTCDSGFPASFDEPDLATGDWHSHRAMVGSSGVQAAPAEAALPSRALRSLRFLSTQLLHSLIPQGGPSRCLSFQPMLLFISLAKGKRNARVTKPENTPAPREHIPYAGTPLEPGLRCAEYPASTFSSWRSQAGSFPPVSLFASLLQLTQSYLMNFSMTSSTHICSLRKLMPYCHQRRKRFSRYQSVSSSTKCSPLKMALLPATSRRCLSPEETRRSPSCPPSEGPPRDLVGPEVKIQSGTGSIKGIEKLWFVHLGCFFRTMNKCTDKCLAGWSNGRDN